MKVLDANVVLRYLPNDVPDQAEYAASGAEIITFDKSLSTALEKLAD
jgi:predicted nucleic-acid-binding protein